MVNITINNISVSVPEGTTIMEAAKAAGVHIPHLCYLKDINEIGACRLCSVEVEGEDKLVSACNNIVREGMVVCTNSKRVRIAVRTNLALILSEHDVNCTACVRGGNCELQTLAEEYHILNSPFKRAPEKRNRWNQDFPLIRDASKCIRCMRCIQVCDKVQGMGVWDLMSTGSRTHIDVSENRTIEASNCALCGQCITHCPVGALHERNDLSTVMRAIENPEITTVVQIAPAIRTAWGEQLGLEPDVATVNRLAGVLRQIGVDYVFDTSFTADLTIMEEGNEFLKRFTGGELKQYPMFTSCCPGWVRFVKSRYPELVGNLSTAKSPQQMFGAVMKSYFAEKQGIDPDKMVTISIMPCVAKKAEAAIETMTDAGHGQDVDYVLTTREIVRMIQGEHLAVENVEETPFDSLMGDYTGAGVIFGATGGVMEAALRTAYYVLVGENPDPDAFSIVRADESDERPWRDAEVEIAGVKVRAAIVSGLGNADKLCEAIVRGWEHYDFVEVMACPGGCSGGGGQPIHCDGVERAASRGQVLYSIDKNMPVRFSHENKDVAKMYEDYFGAPLGEKSEELLHTVHFGWHMPGEL